MHQVHAARTAGGSTQERMPIGNGKRGIPAVHEQHTIRRFLRPQKAPDLLRPQDVDVRNKLAERRAVARVIRRGPHDRQRRAVGGLGEDLVQQLEHRACIQRRQQ